MQRVFDGRITNAAISTKIGLRIRKKIGFVLVIAAFFNLVRVGFAQTYTFETLNLGQVAGQDGWRAPVSGSQVVSMGSGVNPSKVVGDGTNLGYITRVNNATFSFTPFSNTATNATAQFDLTLTSGAGTGGELFGLGTDVNGSGTLVGANEIGPRFGVTAGPGFVFGFCLQDAAGGTQQFSPLGNYGTMNDWMQLRLVMNFPADTGSLYFRNLSRGSQSFTPVPGLQNIDLNLSAGPAPSTWNGMLLYNTHFGQADNLIPNLVSIPVPEPVSIVLLATGIGIIFIFGMRRRRKVWTTLGAFLVLCFAGNAVFAQTLSRGQQILQQRGLQIMGYISNPAGTIDLNTFAQSNFTGLVVGQTDRTIPLSNSLGPAPGILSGLQLSYGYLNDVEQPYLPNMVCLQLSDEQDITNQLELDAAKNLLADWRTMYPNTIGFTNQPAGYSFAQVQNYQSYVKPDMLMYDWYPFNGTDLGGGAVANHYAFMQAERLAALAGNDGTGAHPIPYGLYLQTFNANSIDATVHDPSASEMRLNQFAAWSFGYTFATAFTYTNTTIFNSNSTPKQPGFSDMAETNRQSRNLGPALVRLQSTDVRLIMGLHKSGASNVTNSRPSSIPVWSPGAGGDSFLTGVSATNLGTDNNGLRGDVIVSHFKPMQGASDLYFMIVNGLINPTGTAAEVSQNIHLTFNFGSSGIDSLERLSRDTGLVETVPLVHDSGSLYHLDLVLEGGTGDLFKYKNGSLFVVPEPSTIALASLGILCLWCCRSPILARKFRCIEQVR